MLLWTQTRLKQADEEWSYFSSCFLVNQRLGYEGAKMADRRGALHNDAKKKMSKFCTKFIQLKCVFRINEVGVVSGDWGLPGPLNGWICHCQHHWLNQFLKTSLISVKSLFTRNLLSSWTYPTYSQCLRMHHRLLQEVNEDKSCKSGKSHITPTSESFIWRCSFTVKVIKAGNL